MKHICHLCNKEYDCGRDCAEPQSDVPCPECASNMDVTTQTIECLPKEARDAIVKTIREVQFRLSACWRDGFTKHSVGFDNIFNFSVRVLLTKEDKKNGQNN